MRLALARVAPPMLLGALPLLVLGLLLWTEVGDGQVAPDLRYGLYRQAVGLVKSGVGFEPLGTPMDGQNRVYTVLTTLIASPLTILPVGVAAALVTALLIAAAAATLFVLRVADPRIYGVVFLWPPVLSGIQSGNLTLFLGLLAALGWRHRNRRYAPGVILGFAAAAKVFMWPIVIWLIATRRWSAAVSAAAVGAASILLIIPFGDPLDYFRVARSNADAMGERAYTIYVLAGANGAARLAWLAIGALALLGVFVTARRSPSEGGASFALAIAACILCSPIVWLHYFALLVVPLAIMRPRFGVLWLAPLIYWLAPFGEPARWQIVAVLSTMLTVVAALVVSDHRSKSKTA